MSLCPHGIRIEHKRCYQCEDIAAAEMRAHKPDKMARRINKLRKPTRRYNCK